MLGINVKSAVKVSFVYAATAPRRACPAAEKNTRGNTVTYLETVSKRAELLSQWSELFWLFCLQKLKSCSHFVLLVINKTAAVNKSRLKKKSTLRVVTGGAEWITDLLVAHRRCFKPHSPSLLYMLYALPIMGNYMQIMQSCIKTGCP